MTCAPLKSGKKDGTNKSARETPCAKQRRQWNSRDKQFQIQKKTVVRNFEKQIMVPGNVQFDYLVNEAIWEYCGDSRIWCVYFLEHDVEVSYTSARVMRYVIRVRS